MDSKEVLAKFRHEVLSKEPYRMNLVELLHANASKRILTEHYPQLVGLFNELFGMDEQSDGDFGCWRIVDAPYNEAALDAFLREKADRFMNRFVVEVASH